MPYFLYWLKVDEWSAQRQDTTYWRNSASQFVWNQSLIDHQKAGVSKQLILLNLSGKLRKSIRGLCVVTKLKLAEEVTDGAIQLSIYNTLSS